ncbi:MAG: SLC13 family permease [Flavobacteriales bacterium]|nr:SLC13 family permease [Flavobacteriales bacterium]
MSPHEWIVLVTITGALVLFVSNRLSVDLVALLLIAVLLVTGVLTPAEAVAGFSDPATLTVAFLFVLSAALLRTGVLATLGPALGARARIDSAFGLMAFMLAVAVVSAFINNTPIVAVLIPVAVQMARVAHVHPAKLLIPLSFGTILGGICTLIGTSTNIVVSGLAEQAGQAPLGMFQMTPVGLVFMAAGVLYMGLVGRHLLPSPTVSTDLREVFGMAGYLTQIELHAGGRMVGKRIMDSLLVKQLDMDIIAVDRSGERFTMPAGDMVLQAGDRLTVRCDVARIRELKDQARIGVRPDFDVAGDDLRARGTTLVEMVITANSPLAGQTLHDADLIRRYRAVPLALRRREEVLHDRLHDVELASGDVVLAEVRAHYVETLRKLERTPDAPFALLTESPGIPEFDRKRFLIVALLLLGVVVCSSTGVLPVMVAALLATVLVVLFGALNMKEVYEAVEWRIVFLMAGAFALGAALHKTGLDLRAAGALVDSLGGYGPVAVVGGLYLFTALLTEMVSNTATAALMTPLAIGIAERSGLNATPFIMTIAFAASASFMSPIGYQTNAMVFSAGQYRYVDFMRVGAPLQLLLWVLAMMLIPRVYPF